MKCDLASLLARDVSRLTRTQRQPYAIPLSLHGLRVNCDQTGKPQQLLYTAFNLGVSSLGYRDSCYEHNVIASADLRKPQPHNLADACLRTRFRTTAPPTLRLTEKPKRLIGSPLGSKQITRSRSDQQSPFRRMSWKRALPVSRWSRFNG